MCGLLGKNRWHRIGKPWIKTSFLKLKFSFFNDHFLLFILTSVAANHNTATESDVLNKVAGVLKYAHDKIVAGVVERW